MVLGLKTSSVAAETAAPASAAAHGHRTVAATRTTEAFATSASSASASLSSLTEGVDPVADVDHRVGGDGIHLTVGPSIGVDGA